MPKDFGARLKREMAAKKLSQAELARRVGVSQPAICYYVAGREPRLSVYERMLKELPGLKRAAS